ncbi:hypothetical protein AAHE18_16G267300 [Arachis hypogaea]|nr:uncharacterized protein DS421_16g561600 [Arachis hypogaea]
MRVLTRLPPHPNTHTKHPSFDKHTHQHALRVSNQKPSLVNGTAAAIRGCRRLHGLVLPLSQIHTARPSLLARARHVVHSPGDFAVRVRGFRLLRHRVFVVLLSVAPWTVVTKKIIAAAEIIRSTKTPTTNATLLLQE